LIEVVRMILERSLFICLVCSSLIPAFAQQPAPANRRITLDVVVADKHGDPVSGLNQQDFTLLDNKGPQKLLAFQAVTGPATDPPVSVILLVDEANASFSSVATERDQLEKFFRLDGGALALPVSIDFLSDAGLAIGDNSSKDGNAMAAELVQRQTALRTIRRSQGFYGAADRVGLALQAIARLADTEAPKPGRKLVIWVSPGWPLLANPNIEYSTKNRQNLFSTIVAVSDELRQAGITLYAVDPLGTSDAVGYQTTEYKVFLKGVKNQGQAQVGNLALQVIATQSGGLVLNSSNDIAGEIAKCVRDASAFYVISFDGLPGDGPNEYHALDVKIDKPGLTARTRAGYYAQP
jgi:VWFA-related protein